VAASAAAQRRELDEALTPDGEGDVKRLAMEVRDSNTALKVALAAREETAAALGALEPRAAAARRGRDGLARLLGRLGEYRAGAPVQDVLREGLRVAEAALQELVREGEDAATSDLALLAALRDKLAAAGGQGAGSPAKRQKGNQGIRTWTAEEDSVLREMYSEEVVEALGKTVAFEAFQVLGRLPGRSARALQGRWDVLSAGQGDGEQGEGEAGGRDHDVVITS
jgi:hypothetical protein